MSALEAAVGFAVLGSVLAVATPAFVRELHASRFAEPVNALNVLGERAIAYAEANDTASAFPATAPLTPATVPRGTRELDPDGTWDHPTWRALDFRASAEGEPHSFSFAFDGMNAPAGSTFVAHAHGDLDGDGVTSTFEIRGHTTGDGHAVVEPGMVVIAETE
jgi:hypothetical protein